MPRNAPISPVYEYGMYERIAITEKKYSIRDGVQLPEHKITKHHKILINMNPGATLVVRDERLFNIFRNAIFQLNGKMIIYYPTTKFEGEEGKEKKVMRIQKLGIILDDSFKALEEKYAR